MTQSRTDDISPVVLINVYKGEIEKQDTLVECLTVLNQAMRELPGFISATVHRGVNGKHVANYAIWNSAADWKAMTRDPAVVAAMSPIMALATFEPHLYEAGEVIE